MMKRYIVLGAGETGFEMAYDLLSRKTTKKVHVVRLKPAAWPSSVM